MNQPSGLPPTVASQVTPTGRGAVAVVRVIGPAASDAVGQRFSAASGRTPREWPLGRIVFGRWGGDAGEEVVACRRSPDQLEVHCHGGAAAVGRVLSDLANAGCPIVPRVMPDGESPLASEARRALSNALTLRTAGVLIDQWQGALEQMAARAVRHIQEGQSRAAADLLSAAHAHAPFGGRLTTPWRVALAGRPNAGKSSLLNAIVGYRRAIVHPAPGTTRDAIGETTAVDGWPVKFSDTAGLRAGAGPVEREGIRRAEATVAEADLVLWVRDLSEPVDETETPPADAARLLAVWNKRDLVPSQATLNPGELLVSALTSEGLPALLTELSLRLVPNPPPAGAAVPFLPRHESLIAAAAAACEAGRPDEALRRLAELTAPAGRS